MKELYHGNKVKSGICGDQNRVYSFIHHKDHHLLFKNERHYCKNCYMGSNVAYATPKQPHQRMPLSTSLETLLAQHQFFPCIAEYAYRATLQGHAFGTFLIAHAHTSMGEKSSCQTRREGGILNADSKR